MQNLIDWVIVFIDRSIDLVLSEKERQMLVSNPGANSEFEIYQQMTTAYFLPKVQLTTASYEIAGGCCESA